MRGPFDGLDRMIGSLVDGVSRVGEAVNTREVAESLLERIKDRTLRGLDANEEAFAPSKTGKPVTVASDSVFSKIEVVTNSDGSTTIVAPGQTGAIVAFQDSLRPFFGPNDSDMEHISSQVRSMIARGDF